MLAMLAQQDAREIYADQPANADWADYELYLDWHASQRVEQMLDIVNAAFDMAAIEDRETCLI